jgi:hypothetical protein
MPPPKKATTKPATTPAPVPVVEKSEVKGSGKPKIPAVAAAAAPRVPTHAEIQKRAYEIYASRGYTAGDPNADWTEAERQLKAGL